jgi:hypothetical protein
MSRLSVVALVVVASVAVVACADNILKERPARAVRSTPTKVAFKVAGSAKGESSVCGAYRRQLRVVQLRRATQPDQAEQLKARELSLNAIIADACE